MRIVLFIVLGISVMALLLLVKLAVQSAPLSYDEAIGPYAKCDKAIYCRSAKERRR